MVPDGLKEGVARLAADAPKSARPQGASPPTPKAKAWVFWRFL
jgi:hypothetical protein